MTEESLTTLSLQIALTAAEAPDRTALSVGPNSITYAALDRLGSRVTAALRREGAKAGDVIAFVGQNSLAQVGAMIGATRLGAVLVPLPASAEAAAISAMLKDSGARYCFADNGVEANFADVRLLSLSAEAFQNWLPLNATEIDHAPEGDEPASIIYSSGTTGTPKGIVQSHRYRSRILTGGASRGYTPDAITLLATPLYSNTTLASFLQTFGVGGHVVLMTKFNAENWLATAQRHRATHAMLVPVMIERILRDPTFESTDLSSFRMKYCTSAPFSADLKREVLARWPGGLIEFYGMTEGGASFALRAHEHPDKLHTVGKIALGGVVRIVDEQGEDVGEGQAGEVITSAPGIMIGYHNRPEATAEVVYTDPAGQRWLRTGDIGQLDADGFLSIIDRKKDMIISGGFNIYPADIEAVMRQHPHVEDVSVIGVPSVKWGETPVAFVVSSQTGEEELKDWLNARLGKMQRVADVVLVDSLPRSVIGKVLKRDLRDRYLSPAGAEAEIEKGQGIILTRK